MTLTKLTRENLIDLSGKKICIFEKSVSYLEELCDRYDILGTVSYIVDTNGRNAGGFVFREKTLEVFGLDKLLRIDLQATVIVITSDYYREAFEQIVHTLGDMLEAKDSSINVYYFANRETEYGEAYRARYMESPLENIIVFRSGPHASSYVKGMDFADNARALFEYALATGVNQTYELVWLVKNPAEFKRYGEIENVRFLSFDWSVSDNQDERNTYYRALCLARYIFFTDAYGFARNCRDDQIRVQLWHGCGFKTRVNFVRCEKRYEYTTVISDLYASIHADIYGLRGDQVLVTGYAKQDWLFHPDKRDMERLHVPDGDRYIFWLPTFRSTERKLELLNEYDMDSETGLPVVNTREKMICLDALLAEKDIVLVVKLHPFQDRNTVRCENCTHIHLIENGELVAQDVPINRLLGHAAALISDYSSAAVDFMLLDKPIAFMLEDVEEYRQSRGFVFENIMEWLPGKEMFTFDDVCAFVEEIASGSDTTKEKRQILRNKMHRYCDDGNCERILEVFGIDSIKAN